MSERIELDIPIACTLGESALQKREVVIQREIVASAQEIIELKDGYGLMFSAENLPNLINFITFERECCQFFKFELHFEPQKGPIWMNIRGADGTKQFLRQIIQ